MRSCTGLLWVLATVALAACDEEALAFELNERRVAELAIATCACSQSISNQACAQSYEETLRATLLAQLQAGRVRVLGEHWRACLSDLRSCVLTSRACADLFEGALAEGQSCDLASEECAPGLACVADAESDPQDECAFSGTCEELPRVSRGEPCSRNEECERRDICGVATSGERDGERVCRRPIEAGDRCPVDHGLLGTTLCEVGTGCVPSDDGVLCGEPLGAGEACVFVVNEQDDQEEQLTALAACQSDHFCNPESGVCERFDFPTGAQEGKACDARSDCLPGLVCLDDECARPLPNGSACDGPDQCVARCVDDVCVARFEACGLP